MFQIIWIKPDVQSMEDWEPVLEHMVDQEEVEYWYNYLTKRYPDKEFQVITVH
jgi:hypothetical protein